MACATGFAGVLLFCVMCSVDLKSRITMDLVQRDRTLGPIPTLQNQMLHGPPKFICILSFVNHFDKDVSKNEDSLGKKQTAY